eukprot:350000-Chlamydomonas_euryale.AAC.5
MAPCCAPVFLQEAYDSKRAPVAVHDTLAHLPSSLHPARSLHLGPLALHPPTRPLTPPRPPSTPLSTPPFKPLTPPFKP